MRKKNYDEIKKGVKKKIEEYLDNKISLEDLYLYLIEDVPYTGETIIEDIVLDVDMTTDKELTDIDIEEEIKDEATLKKLLVEYLVELEKP